MPARLLLEVFALSSRMERYAGKRGMERYAGKREILVSEGLE